MLLQISSQCENKHHKSIVHEESLQLSFPWLDNVAYARLGSELELTGLGELPLVGTGLEGLAGSRLEESS